MKLKKCCHHPSDFQVAIEITMSALWKPLYLLIVRELWASPYRRLLRTYELQSKAWSEKPVFWRKSKESSSSFKLT